MSNSSTPYLPLFCAIPGHSNNGQTVSVEYAKGICEAGRCQAASTSIQPTILSSLPHFGNSQGLHVGNKVLGTDGKKWIQFH